MAATNRQCFVRVSRIAFTTGTERFESAVGQDPDACSHVNRLFSSPLALPPGKRTEWPPMMLPPESRPDVSGLPNGAPTVCARRGVMGDCLLPSSRECRPPALFRRLISTFLIDNYLSDVSFVFPRCVTILVRGVPLDPR